MRCRETVVSAVWDPGRNWKVQRTAKTQANTPVEQRNDKGTRREERAIAMMAERASDVSMVTHRRTPKNTEEHRLLKIKSGVCRLVIR